jgi:hypothetical protein
MTATANIVESIVQDALRAGRCDDCNKSAKVLFEEVEIVSGGERIVWHVCAAYKSRRETARREDRASVESIRPGIEALLAKIDTMGRDELYAALQRLAQEVLYP